MTGTVSPGCRSIGVVGPNSVPLLGRRVAGLAAGRTRCTPHPRNDWSVCTTWAIKQKKFYLLDVWRPRVEFPALRRKIVNLALSYQAGTVLIEKAGPGLQLVQDLRNDQTHGFPRPIGIVPDGDKWMRMEAQTPRFEAGHVLLPKEAPWLATFLDELLAFPRGRRDDQVDSVSQFLKWAWVRSRRSRIALTATKLIGPDDGIMDQPFSRYCWK